MNIKERIQSVKFSTTKDIITEIPPLPITHMAIEINNMCNHDCIFCHSRKLKRKKICINEDFMVRILNDAYNEGVREVGFFI